MDTQQVDEKAVFNAARRIADAAAREEFLRQACGDDQPVIERIRELLRIHDQEPSFLESPAADLRPTAHPSAVTEQPGTFIGPYKLLQQIGEGGMGVVFMAQQTEPIQRTVALKIIKPGMDSTQVVARFEAERQALALMDHPNVAKVLDAGMTATGRPYFVMDLVKGVPITQFCDDRQLSLRARLELLLPVCQAVQHAHQKGIIHRDIKPTNVLVAEYDHHAVPKVIDFGIAKATAQKLTERTMFTQFGQLLGTFEYMSPEQAKLNQLDVDTRSDIYSLGVLLYELLTGSTPFAQKRLREAAFDEVLRIIREEEPPKPSTKLSSSDRLPSIAANRHTEPARLTKAVRGELDWIVMKALDKERDRRYQTAAGLAEDIGRYLTDQPVAARRPTRVYRFRKFARRNKLAILAGTVMVAAISLGLAATLYFAASASREAKHATAALVQAELNGRTAQGINTFFTDEVLGLADPNRSNRAGITLLDALEVAAEKIETKFPNDPVLRAELLDRLGGVYIASGKAKKAVPQLQHAVDLRKSFADDKDPATLKSRFLLGWALHGVGRWDEALDMLQSVMDEQTAVLGVGHPDTLQTMDNLVVLLTQIRGFGVDARATDRDLEIAQKAYDAALGTLGPRHFATLRAENTLGLVLRWRNKPAEALPYARAAARGLTEVVGSDNPETMYAIYDYAACLQKLQRYQEAVTELKPLVAVRNRVLGPLHGDSLWASSSLAQALRNSGDSTQSLAVLEDVYAHLMQSPELANWRHVQPTISLADNYIAVGRDDRAAELYSLVYKVLSAPYDEVAPAARAKSLNVLAGTFITTTSAKIRDVDRGIQLATQACELTNFKRPDSIRTLVRGYLDKGDLERYSRPTEAAAAFRRGMEIYDEHAAELTTQPGPDKTIEYARIAYVLSVTDRQDKAAEFVRRVAADAPDPTDLNAAANALYYLALAQLCVGDQAGYRATCKALVDMPQSKLEGLAKPRPVWTSCLGPNALNDPSLQVKLADELVASKSVNEQHYGLFLLGAAHYRANQYEQAAKRLNESIAAYPSSLASESDSINYHRLFLAMTKWQLGQKDEARRLLAETQQAIEKELQSPSGGWNRLATLEVLRREAEGLIGPQEVDLPKNNDKSDRPTVEP